MIEKGVITSLDGKYAIVKVDKKDECSKCGMCLFPKNASSVDFRVKNNLGASVGDSVTFATEKDAKLLGALLAFFVPLLLIVISAVVTYVFIKKEIWMLILSVISIVLWYTILAVIDKKLKNSVKFVPYLISVDKKEKKDNE